MYIPLSVFNINGVWTASSLAGAFAARGSSFTLLISLEISEIFDVVIGYSLVS